MSYINFYEKEYNNGKINLDEVSKKREYYNSLDAGEKSTIDKKYSSSVKIISSEEKVDNSVADGALEGVLGENGLPDETLEIKYYYLWLLSCGFFGLIFFVQQGYRGNFSDLVILDFFFSFLSIGFLPMIFISLICFPIKFFSKINFGKLLFWTSIILGTVNVLNGTFS